jgi:hypothetical protein
MPRETKIILSSKKFRNKKVKRNTEGLAEGLFGDSAVISTIEEILESLI